MTTIWLWIGFVAFVLIMLALDLLVINREAHAVRMREALVWTGFCVALALGFSVLVYLIYANDWLEVREAAGAAQTGGQAFSEFLTGWILEYSLSLDNLFVIATIFAYFKIPAQFQHRVLFWGILGALVLRGVMIALGAALIHRFSWVTYFFGALLIFSAIKMLVIREDNINWEANLVVRLARRFYPIAPSLDGQKFFTKLDGKTAITPLMLVLLLVESADVVFAVDSIPAIFAVTQDPFLVFTSNVFAILGLRSLYFALAGLMGKFRHLKVSLVFVLAYVGVKMLIQSHYKIDTTVSLAIIATILGVGIIASLLSDRRDRTPPEPPLGPDVERVAKITIKQTKKIVVLIVGSLLVIGGVVMAIPAMPGPGWPVILLGLTVLASQFYWAKRLLVKTKQVIAAISARVRSWVRRAPAEPASDQANRTPTSAPAAGFPLPAPREREPTDHAVSR